MKNKSKSSLGQWLNNRLYLSDDEKKQIIKDYLSGTETKQSVYSRYTGYATENGKILKWMRQFDMENKLGKKTNFVSMPTRKKIKIKVLIILRHSNSKNGLQNWRSNFKQLR